MKDMNQKNYNTSILYVRKRHSKFNNYKPFNTKKNPNKSFAPRNGVTYFKSSFDKRKMNYFYSKNLEHLIKDCKRKLVDEATNSNSKR
jgi:hypothetical protein